MKSSPGWIQQQRPLADQAARLQPGADRPGPPVQLRVGQMDLLVLAVDEVGEGDVVGLATGTMPHQFDQRRGTEERTGQVIQVNHVSSES